MMRIMKKMIVIGGVPGSGKSYIGKEIAKSIGFVFIDKDTVSRYFTETLLVQLGLNKHDRESEEYINLVRDIEYKTMMKIAIENLELGQGVICSAPFIKELLEQEWLEDLKFELDIIDATLNTVWIHVDSDTAKERIISRAAERDTWKLANWDQYLLNIPLDTPGGVENMIEFDNSASPEIPIHVQVESLIRSLKDE